MRTVRPRHAAAWIVVAVLFSVLTGCGGAPAPEPLPKPSGSTSPSASASATPSAPVMPAAARAKTDRAVEAFARYFVDIINFTAASGNREAIDNASLRTCESCRSIAERAFDTYEAGGSINGNGWSVTRINVVPNQPRSRVYVELSIKQSPETVIARPGEAPKQFPGGDHTFNMVLTLRETNWAVARLDLVA